MLLSHQHIDHKHPEAAGRGYDTRPSLWGMTGDGDGPILLVGPSAATLLQGTAKLVINQPDKSTLVAQNKAAGTISMKGSAVQSLNCL